MAAINTSRVVVGGLLAGVVMNALDMFWNLVVLRDDMIGIAQRLGMDAQTATSFSTGLPWIIVDFVIGLAVVWNYAAVRPRFGPPPFWRRLRPGCSRRRSCSDSRRWG